MGNGRRRRLLIVALLLRVQHRAAVCGGTRGRRPLPLLLEEGGRVKELILRPCGPRRSSTERPRTAVRVHPVGATTNSVANGRRHFGLERVLAWRGCLLGRCWRHPLWRWSRLQLFFCGALVSLPGPHRALDPINKNVFCLVLSFLSHSLWLTGLVTNRSSRSQPPLQRPREHHG